MLHLVGETIDAKRAHYRARAGTLTPLVRGVYVESECDIETVILGQRGAHRPLSLPQCLPVVGKRAPAGPGTGRTAVHQRPAQINVHAFARSRSSRTRPLRIHRSPLQ